MRKIDFTNKFNRDYKRELKGQHGHTLKAHLGAAIQGLVTDTPLPANLRDHPLSGNWANHRDCHIRPGLVLIYRLIGQDAVLLVRLGSHSELDL